MALQKFSYSLLAAFQRGGSLLFSYCHLIDHFTENSGAGDIPHPCEILLTDGTKDLHMRILSNQLSRQIIAGLCL